MGDSEQQCAGRAGAYWPAMQPEFNAKAQGREAAKRARQSKEQPEEENNLGMKS